MSIQYSEYKSIENLLNQSNQDNVYEELMKKEKDTLQTVNKVIKYYTDNKVNKDNLIHMSVIEIINKFTSVMYEVGYDMMKIKKFDELAGIFIKDGQRIIYIGILLIVISIFLLLMSV